jgi:hypothetical protein
MSNDPRVDILLEEVAYLARRVDKLEKETDIVKQQKMNPARDFRLPLSLNNRPEPEYMEEVKKEKEKMLEK